MKKTKKLFPAVIMLMISAILLSSASYAWFTMSREVTATGMNVTVTAPTNLLISNDTDATTFGATATDTLSGSAAKINPASSVNGSTFYALKDGSVVDAATGARNTTSTFESVTGDTYYKDFVYHVKTEGDSSVDVAIKSLTVTSVNNTDNADSPKPVRTAVIVSGGSTSNVVSANSTTVKAIKTIQANGTVISTDVDDVNLATLKTTANTGTTIFTVAPSTTVDVTVRVWYEGEDAACTVTNGSNFNFNVDLVLADKAAD